VKGHWPLAFGIPDSIPDILCWRVVRRQQISETPPPVTSGG
jgi:hypothetical protein